MHAVVKAIDKIQSGNLEAKKSFLSKMVDKNFLYSLVPSNYKLLKELLFILNTQELFDLFLSISSASAERDLFSDRRDICLEIVKMISTELPEESSAPMNICNIEKVFYLVSRCFMENYDIDDRIAVLGLLSYLIQVNPSLPLQYTPIMHNLAAFILTEKRLWDSGWKILLFRYTSQELLNVDPEYFGSKTSNTSFQILTVDLSSDLFVETNVLLFKDYKCIKSSVDFAKVLKTIILGRVRVQLKSLDQNGARRNSSYSLPILSRITNLHNVMNRSFFFGMLGRIRNDSSFVQNVEDLESYTESHDGSSNREGEQVKFYIQRGDDLISLDKESIYGLIEKLNTVKEHESSHSEPLSLVDKREVEIFTSTDEQDCVPFKDWYETFSFQDLGGIGFVETKYFLPLLKKQDSDRNSDCFTYETVLRLFMKKDYYSSDSALVNCNINSKCADIFLADLVKSFVGSLPRWFFLVLFSYPFLLTFEFRLMYFELQFGFTRFINKYYTPIESRKSSSNLDYLIEQVFKRKDIDLRLSRQKFRIHRNKLLLSAIKLFHGYINSRSNDHSNVGRNPTILEIEFFDEVGTGLGPTLEFYALVCEKISEDYVTSQEGEKFYFFKKFDGMLYPWLEVEYSKKPFFGKFFEFLGKFIAKSLVDFRLIDCPLHPIFIHLILVERIDDVTLNNIRDYLELVNSLDVGYYNSYKELLRIYEARETKDEDVKALMLYDGEEQVASKSKLQEYLLKQVRQLFSSEQILGSIKHFRKGFSSIIPMEYFNIFIPHEIHSILTMNVKDYEWTRESLLEAIDFDHGYSSSSQVMRWLLEVLLEFDMRQRTDFISFVTGTQRLPRQGLKGLSPKMTVVRKSGEGSSDFYLPSVMTCANYIKMPEYSSKAILKERLLLSITEGQKSFHLS